MSSMNGAPSVDQSGTAILNEYAGIVWRNKWPILGCVTLSTVLAWGYCVIAPNYYRSETLIVAEQQKVLENVARQAGEDNFEKRLFIIQRRIMSLDFLSDIAKELNPYPKALEEGGEASAALEFSGAVKVEKIKTDPAGNAFTGVGEIEAFTVSFLHQDPKTAMKVTARIAEKFIGENVKEREDDAEFTVRFVDDELKRIKLELEKKEEQIGAFKKSHMNELPQHTETTVRSLDRLESEIQTVTESIQRHSDRLAMVEKSMQEYRLYARQNRAFTTSSKEQADPLFARLKDLREKQIKLKAEFKDEYPEVILTKEELRHVEEQLVELYGPDALKADNKKPIDPYLQDLVKQEGEERSELNLAKQRLQILYASRKDHEKHIARSHEVEQDLLVLERDYGSMKANYAMLLDKRLHARVTENMEKRSEEHTSELQ